MEPISAGILGIILLFVLLAIGLPIGVSMALIGTAGIWLLISGSAAVAKLAIVPFSLASKYDFIVLPLFLLMAEIIFVTDMGKDLYTLAAKWLGRFRGGLAMATIAGCAGFSTISASSLATVATMGAVAKPEMDKYSYHPRLSTGCIAAGSNLGTLIPPSGILIIYGILTETSIGKLFIAGIIPGILLALFYIVTIYIICLLNPNLGPRAEKSTVKEKILAFKHCGEILVLIVIVIGGLVLGWFTPTEAGAVGAAGAIFISMIRRRLTWERFKSAIFKTMRTTGLIYGILIGAFILNSFLAVSNIPNALASFASGLTLPPIGIMAIIMLIYLVLGCFLDAAAMQVLTIPIFFPIAIHLGFDAIWFGIIVARAVEIAMITPPMGMNVFVMAGIARDVPMYTIFRGIIPFLIADLIHVALLILFPALALFLPSLSAK